MRYVHRIWLGMVLLGTCVTAALILRAPPEAAQGYVQKIFYVHVGSALAMYVGFVTAAFASLIVLVRRSARADVVAYAGAEVGVVFCSLVLVTGPIWARPIWGVWWTWEPRLTSTLFAWLIFVAYLLLRQIITDPVRQRTAAAVFALFGALDLPLIFFAVRLWRGAHPSVLGHEDSMPWSMRTPLLAAMVTLPLLAGFLIRVRARTLRAAQERCESNEGLHG